jgi:phage gp29-like protein
VWDDEEPADMEAMSNALPGLVEAGLQISRKWAHDRLKIPLAEEGEEVLTRPSAPSASPFPPPPAAARQQITGPHAACNASEATPQGRIQQQVVDKLARDAGPGLQAMLAEIRRWVDEADSLEALRDRILQGYGNLPTAELSQLMGDAFAVAHALGRDNVAREAGQLADD